MKENQPSAIDQLTAKKDLYGVLIQKRETRVDVVQEMLKTKTFYPVDLPAKGQTITNEDVQRVIVHGEKNKKRHERVGLHLERVNVSITSLREKQEIIDKKIVGYHRAVSYLSELKEADTQYEQIKELYDKGYIKKTVYERVAGHVKQLRVLPSQDEELASWVDVIKNETEKAKNQEPAVQTAVKNENEDAAFQVASKKETDDLISKATQMLKKFFNSPKSKSRLEKGGTLGQFLQKNNLSELADIINVLFEKKDIDALKKIGILFKKSDICRDYKCEKFPNSPFAIMCGVFDRDVFLLAARIQYDFLSDVEKYNRDRIAIGPLGYAFGEIARRATGPKGKGFSGTEVDYSGDHGRWADE